MNTGNLPVYTVSQINAQVKSTLEGNPRLQNVVVRGEVSNYRSPSASGHHYFSLKDASGVLRCVMYAWDAARTKLRLVNGMEVLAFGQVSVYPAGGEYQLKCKTVALEGQGALDAAFERMRRRLEAEGLFDPAHKVPVPRYPHRIAVVTSPTGAAIQDILINLKARWPMAAVLVAPVRVQGQGAAEEIAAAIHRLNNRADIDLIITGRGGGSKEELWAFNEEAVARAIYLSNIPVISAVGHEPDVTIADYVADLRATTPTKAAVQAVPDQKDERRRLEQLNQRMARALQTRLAAARRELDRLKGSRALQNIKAPVEDRRQELADLRRRMALALRGETDRGRQTLENRQARLPLALKGQLTRRRAALGRLAMGLDAMSPLKVLGRGYAIARMGEDVVSSIGQAQAGDRLDVLVSDGVLRCEVREKEEQSWK